MLVEKIKKAIKNPKFARSLLLAKVKKPFVKKRFSGSVKNRSQSDDGLYLGSIQKFLSSQNSFDNFKQDPFYQMILEHTSRDLGQEYLNIIKQQTPEFLDESIELYKQNDELGNADVYDYDDIGLVSPSTLYYLKIASDLKVLFQNNIGGKIAEIGCGYGGQALILDRVFELNKNILFDIDIVGELTSRYLEHFTLHGSYVTTTLNKVTSQNYDLVISNYAFSELPASLQKKYIEKVLANSSRGYLIMNSGRDGGIKEDRLTLAELKDLLPEFEIFDEKPLTAPQNYVIVWGHTGSI